jgi:hypothetical protein
MAKASSSNAMNSLRTNLWHKRPATEVAEATSHLEATRVHHMELEATRTYLEDEDLDLTYLQAEIADILAEALEYIKVNTNVPAPTTQVDYAQVAANRSQPGGSGLQTPVVIAPSTVDLTVYQAFDLDTSTPDLNQTDPTPVPQAQVSRHDLTIQQCQPSAPVVTSMQRGVTHNSVYTPRRNHFDTGPVYSTPPPALPPALPPGLPASAPVGVTPAGITAAVASRIRPANAFNTSWGQPPPMPQHNQSWGQGAEVNTTWAPMHNSTGLNQSQAAVPSPRSGGPPPVPNPHQETPPSWQPPPVPNLHPEGPSSWQPPTKPPSAQGVPPAQTTHMPYTNNAYSNNYGRNENGSRYGGGSPGFQDSWQRERGPMKLALIQLATFSGEDISTYFAFKQDFIAYIHMREGMKVEEKMARLLSLTLGGPAHDLIVNLTRDEAGYYEALEQLDTDFGNQDRQFAVALGTLTELPEIDLAQPATVRAARIAIRKVISHLKQIPGTNVASHALTALLALKFTPEARFALNLFQQSQRAERLSFELFEQWSQSQLLMTHTDPLSRSSSKPKSTSVTLPYQPKLPTKTVSLAGAQDDSSGDGCSDLEQTMTVMAVSRDEVGKYSVCLQCSEPHMLSKCPQFRAFNDEQRVTLIKKTRTCFRYIQGRHRRSECKKNWTCRDCNSDEHHTLLHGAFVSKLLPSIPSRTKGGPPPPPPSSGTHPPAQPRMSNEEILKILNNLTAHMSMGVGAIPGAQAHQVKVAMPVADDILRTLSYLVAPAMVYHPLSPDR